ncbi:RNA polymerase sigma factor [Streptomyces noursei]
MNTALTTRLSAEAAERLDRLFREHRTRLIAYARLNGVDPAQAEDIASEAWIEVASRVHRDKLQEGPGLPKLLALMVRTAVTAHVRVARNRELPMFWYADSTTDTLFPHAPSADRELEEPYDGPEFDARIRAALDQLPETWRKVMEYHCEGLTYAATASHLGLSQVRVREIVKAAARALRPVVDGTSETPAVPSRARAGVRRATSGVPSDGEVAA